MTDPSRGLDDVDLDRIVRRVNELPTRMRSLRVETRGWVDQDLSALASERALTMLVRHRPRPAGPPIGRSERTVRSWMEFGDDAWRDDLIGVWPARWREDLEHIDPKRGASRVTSARDGDRWWSDRDGAVQVVDTRGEMSSLANGWVVSRRWVSAADLALLGGSTTVAGGSGLRVLVTPRQGATLGAGPWHAGDRHEAVVDVETGMTLALTGYVDDAPFSHHEVVDRELDAPISTELTAVPADAPPPPPQPVFRAPQDVAAAVSLLTLLSPMWLPPGYTFQTAFVRVDDDGETAGMFFWRDRREFVRIYECTEVPLTDDSPYEWERVERGTRTVFVSDVTDAPGQRIAVTTLAGTSATVYASVSAGELLDLAFSFQVLRS